MSSARPQRWQHTPVRVSPATTRGLLLDTSAKSRRITSEVVRIDVREFAGVGVRSPIENTSRDPSLGVGRCVVEVVGRARSTEIMAIYVTHERIRSRTADGASQNRRRRRREIITARFVIALCGVRVGQLLDLESPVVTEVTQDAVAVYRSGRTGAPTDVAWTHRPPPFGHHRLWVPPPTASDPHSHFAAPVTVSDPAMRVPRSARNWLKC